MRFWYLVTIPGEQVRGEIVFLALGYFGKMTFYLYQRGNSTIYMV